MSAGLAVAVRQARDALAVCILALRVVRTRVEEARAAGRYFPEHGGLPGTETAVLRSLDGAAADLRAALEELAAGDAKQAERRVRSAVARSRLAVATLRPEWIATEDQRGAAGVEDQLAELASAAEAAARVPAAPVRVAA